MGFTEEDLNCFEKDPFDEWMKVELEEISVSAERSWWQRDNQAMPRRSHEEKVPIP